MRSGELSIRRADGGYIVTDGGFGSRERVFPTLEKVFEYLEQHFEGRYKPIKLNIDFQSGTSRKD